MTLRNIVEKFLESTPLFRERSQKDRGIVHLLLQEHHRESGFKEIFPSTKDSLVKFVKDYASADRAWRQILEERPDLRGGDYWKKTDAMHKKRLDLGYSA